MPTPPTRSSIKVTQTLDYRGGTKMWSNRYFFTGPDLDTTMFNNLSDALVDEQKLVFTSDVEITETIAYNAGSEIPVFSKTYTTVGTYPTTGNLPLPGDCAAVVRWSTTQRTSKNHPIYLFKYYHGVRYATGNSPDDIIAGQIARYADIGADLIAGLDDGTNNRVLCGPYGAVAQQYKVLDNVRHRDFRN